MSREFVENEQKDRHNYLLELSDKLYNKKSNRGLLKKLVIYYLIVKITVLTAIYLTYVYY